MSPLKKHIAIIDATHAGFVNKNNTYYLEDHMKAAVNTWLTPYRRPVLIHHDEKSDPIGRVTRAEYLDFNAADFKGAIEKNNKPKGQIRLEAEISEDGSVSKIADGRYDTVSVTVSCKYARCSICDQDIRKDGLCEHIRGKTYDGKKAFWYLGDFDYKEVSYVNEPADPYARTVKFEEKTEGIMFKNSLTSEFAFSDVVDDNPVDWSTVTEEDVAMMHWLTIELETELGQDAKLTEEKRKSLPGSAFCGPNKSFPVPDCAHAMAAHRLIGRYKGPGDKNKILSCVGRKAKAMGCGGGKDSQGDTQMTFDEILQRQDVKDHIEKLVKDAKTANSSAIEVLDTKVKTLEKDIVAKDTVITEKTAALTKLETQVTDLKGKIHLSLVDQVFELRKNLRKKDVMDLKEEKDVTTYKAELARRSDESLSDSVKDLSKEPVEDIKITDAAGKDKPKSGEGKKGVASLLVTKG